MLHGMGRLPDLWDALQLRVGRLPGSDNMLCQGMEARQVFRPCASAPKVCLTCALVASACGCAGRSKVRIVQRHVQPTPPTSLRCTGSRGERLHSLNEYACWW